MAELSLQGISIFIPIFSFLLVFIVIYALLIKTKVLGDSQFINIFVSGILSSFFILQASLVEFVKFNSAWFAVFLVCLFMIVVIISFVHGKTEVIFQKVWVAWVLVVALIVFFIISAANIFNWAINFEKVSSWISSDWFGSVLLLIVAAGVAWIISKK
jgi:hypothetical protein